MSLVAALGLTLAFAPSPAAAATPGLTITGDATYDVFPDEHRVAVSVQLVATNHLKDTASRTFSFRTAYLAVQPGTAGFTLTSRTGSPKVSIHQVTDTFTSLKLDLGTNLASGKSLRLTLSFDIRDSGGDPARPVRITSSLVTFDAWAFATPSTPGSTVTVQVPTGYEVSVGRGPLQGPVDDGAGRNAWSSGPLQAPLAYVADIVADREVSPLTETPIEVDLAGQAAPALVRGWPDDPAWSSRVANLVQQALPILEREIGVPWPVAGQLQVNEVLVRGAGGYAGVFAPAERRIDISYAASDAVVIHELAHAWFNGRLVADRWAAEAFASYYGELATRELGLDITPQQPVEPGGGAIPLNAWSSSEPATADAVAKAYAAALELAREVVARAGAERMRSVWDLAARGIGAYRPAPSIEEPVSGPPDWRGLLDLLEEQTGQDFGDLWRAWVARPEDMAALDARSSARAAYTAMVAAAGEWRLPITIRDAMRSWQFDAALTQVAAAKRLLDQRATLAAAAASRGVSLPASLRAAFERPDGLTAASDEASLEWSAIGAIAAAEAARSASGGVIEGLAMQLGLAFQDPSKQLDAAKAAFQSGDVAGARDAATAAQDGWRYAAEAGRWRIVTLVLLALALVTFAWSARRRRRRAAAEPA